MSRQRDKYVSSVCNNNDLWQSECLSYYVVDWLIKKKHVGLAQCWNLFFLLFELLKNNNSPDIKQRPEAPKDLRPDAYFKTNVYI